MHPYPLSWRCQLSSSWHTALSWLTPQDTGGGLSDPEFVLQFWDPFPNALCPSSYSNTYLHLSRLCAYSCLPTYPHVFIHKQMNTTKTNKQSDKYTETYNTSLSQIHTVAPQLLTHNHSPGQSLSQATLNHSLYLTFTHYLTISRYLSLYLSIYLSLYLSLTISLFICLYLSIYLSISISLCISLSPHYLTTLWKVNQIYIDWTHAPMNDKSVHLIPIYTSINEYQIESTSY